MKNPLFRTKTTAERGSVIVGVLVIGTILFVSLTFAASFTIDTNRLAKRTSLHDRALVLAQGAASQGLDWLEGQATPPRGEKTVALLNPSSGLSMTADQTFTVLQPSPDSDFEISVMLTHESRGVEDFWHVAGNATYVGDEAGISEEFHRRAQLTVSQENFAKYELFVNTGLVWSPGLVHFMGFDHVLFGPMHRNNGIGFFPNFWAVSEVTTSVPGDPPIRTFPNWNSYINGVYGESDADQYVNILESYPSPNYPHPPKFYEGIRKLEDNITLPDINVDPRASELRDNAGLNIPADYTNYDSTFGDDFVVELVDPSPANGDGQVSVKQFLGYNSTTGDPMYGPEEIHDIGSINNAMAVYGDIVALEGVVDGRLTVGAFSSETPGQDGRGEVKINDSVEYESRLRYEDAGNEFHYSDAPDVFTPDGADVDQSFVSTLENQVNQLDDILGIVSDYDIVVPLEDIEGNALAQDVDDPIYMDFVAMATGQATPSEANDGSFYPEVPAGGDLRDRPIGRSYRLGGTIQNRAKSWAFFDSGNHEGGIEGPSLWDMRTVQAGGAPPFFPSTGNMEIVPQTWLDGFVADADEALDTPAL